MTEAAQTELADLVPRFRQMASEAGRDPASVPISVWGRKPELDMIKRYQDLQVDRICTSLDAAKADVILPILDTWAELIHKVNG